MSAGPELRQDMPRQETGGQRAAADPAASVWVAANAGSGKTRVLIDRVTRLLLGGTRPGAILCLTFTKAAAAEMANRLYRRLGEWSVLPDEALTARLTELLGTAPEPELLEEARCLFAKVLDAPGRLRIQTIHAFCEALLKRFPLEAGVPPQFAVADEAAGDELLAEARNRLLSDAAHDADLSAALAFVVGAVDEMRFETVLRELAAGRRRLHRFLEAHGDDAAAAIEAVRTRLTLKPGETADSLIDFFVRAAPDADLARAAAALEAGSDTDRERAAAIRAWLAQDAAGRAARLGEWRGAFLTQKGAPRKTLMTKKAVSADPSASHLMLTEQKRVGDLDERCKAIGVAEATAALIRLGKALTDRYEAEKARRALLDYDDLILLARRLLTGRGATAWVLFKLDGGLDHILLDEAQDTSPEQWEVVAALADEFFSGSGAREVRRTVFAVGDAKQSIFSFQGADPAAFAAMHEYFAVRAAAAGMDFRSVELHLSFRSAPAILAAVDAVFRQPEARGGVVEDGVPLVHSAHRKGAAGTVELWPVVAASDDAEPDPWDAPLDYLGAASPPAELARRVAGRIAGWLQDGEMLPSRGRAIRPGDIMILVSRRDAFFEEVVRALKQANVPVAGADRMHLAQQIAVMDLVALGNFALLPGDDLTLATVLKSPFHGLDDDDLFALCWERRGTLWAALRERADEKPHWRAAADGLAALLAQADYVPPFEFFSGVLDRGGRRRLLARLGSEANDPIDEFLALALAYERQHPPSLQGFLAWFERGDVEIKRDMEQGRDEVRVMTVHGAKGLEADIVFLPDTCVVPDGRTDSLVLWSDETTPLPLWPVRKEADCALSAEWREAALEARRREHRRLLYVATTRARDRLYVCGWHRTAARDGAWHGLIEGAVRNMPDSQEIELHGGEAGLRIATPHTDGPASERDARRVAEAGPPPAWLAAPAPAEPSPPRPLAPSRPTASEPPVRSPLGADSGARFRRGRLIHRLLQTLPGLPEAARAAAAGRFLARPALRLSDAEQAEIARETLAVLEEPALAPLFGPDALVEAPIAGAVGGKAIVGQIDRLLIGERSVTLVDYKTNRPPPATEAEVAPAYLSQMASYRALLRDIYPESSITCLLLWTDGPRLMELSDGTLDRHAP